MHVLYVSLCGYPLCRNTPSYRGNRMTSDDEAGSRGATPGPDSPNGSSYRGRNSPFHEPHSPNNSRNRGSSNAHSRSPSRTEFRRQDETTAQNTPIRRGILGGGNAAGDASVSSRRGGIGGNQGDHPSAASSMTRRQQQVADNADTSINDSDSRQTTSGRWGVNAGGYRAAPPSEPSRGLSRGQARDEVSENPMSGALRRMRLPSNVRGSPEISEGDSQPLRGRQPVNSDK